MGTTGSGAAGDLYMVVGTSEVHAGTIGEFRDELDAAVERYRALRAGHQRSVKGPLVVDLGWVTYFDSAGVDLLVETHDALVREGGALRPVNAAGAVRRVLEDTHRWGAVHGSDPIR
ncbi:MAG TPA: STAS domain-containing protein [Acidimicrobiales bacterium]